MRLAVELYGTSVGMLEGDARTFDFVPDAAGMDHFGTNSQVLSVGIPLTPHQRRDHAARRRTWFEELLPEGDQYDHMVAQGRLRRGDTLAFLARYGRDVAGALQLWDLDDPTEPRPPGLAPLSSADVRRLLEDPVGSPLANEATAGKSSLGGVQPKIVLVRTDDGWAQSYGGHPTTHIVKPRLGGTLRSVVFDEEYGSRIARRLGLASHDTTIEVFDGLPALVVERYDRADGGRIHQEDLSQALGARRNEKYQEVGGVVSLRRVAETLRRHAPEADLRRLARAVVLTVAVGNLDMHTKNIALLHAPDGEVRLGPSYDVVPQADRPSDGRLALSVGGVYRHAEMSCETIESELATWGLRRAAAVVREVLDELAGVLDVEEPLVGSSPDLRLRVAGFVEALRRGRPVSG